MILPVGAPSFGEALRYGREVFHALKAVLKSRGRHTAVGDEGGFAPDLRSNAEALETLIVRIEKAATAPGTTFTSASTSRASESSQRRYELERRGRASTPRASALSRGLVERYPIVTIEDGMAEDDWDGWAQLTRRWASACSSSATISSSPTRDPEARHRQASPTRSSSSEPDRHAHRDARSDRDGAARLQRRRLAPLGETEDTTIADIAVATSATRSRPGARRAPIASPSTTSSCASRRSWARRPATRARAPSAARSTREAMLSRILLVVFIVLTAALQYRLWLSPQGMPESRGWSARWRRSASRTRRSVSGTRASRQRSRILRQGLDAVEERARTELGMVGRNESFFQVVESEPAREEPRE
jgi:hypothetical protein